MKLNYFKFLDKIGNDLNIVPVHLSRASMVEDAISTGSLVADLITGGGWPAGRWVALFGPEASAKSTLLYHTIADSIRQEINTEFFDFEGSTDPSYLKKILNMDLNNVFGLRKETGSWEITPQCRYHQPDLGEPYFRYMHRILKVLPDKVQNNGQWYYVYDKKPKGKGEDFDKKLYKNTGRFWVPAENGSLQVIWFIDSLPAMLTERQDEKDESKEIGLQARMFSRYIPLIKSRLARKRCSVVAVNQIRMKPMCLHYDARVMLADGSEMKIGEIVENRLKVDVLSYNFETKQLEIKPIINWFINGKAEKEEFKNLIVQMQGRGQRAEFGITDDHYVFQKGQRVPLRDLKPGDNIQGICRSSLNEDQMQIVYASLLGDGWIDSKKKNLCIAQSLPQKDYCLFKKQVLNLSNGYYSSKGAFTITISKYKIPNIEALYDASYPEERRRESTKKGKGKPRTFSRVVLDNLDLKGLAIYYMDDGHLEEREGSNGITFSIKKYTWADGELFKEALEKLTALSYRHSIGDNYHHISLVGGKSAVQNFLNQVAPYMCEIMKFKLGNFQVQNFGTYKWNNTENTTPLLINYKISKKQSKRSYISRPKHKFRYDIEVADNHNFLIDNLLISNSFGNPEYEVGGEAPKFYCFAEDTYLQTDKGIIKASDAYLETPNKILGEEFLEKPNLYNYMGKSDTIKITTNYGFELKGKLGHSVLALNNRTLLNWTNLLDLTKEHFVALKVGSEIWPSNPPLLNFKFEKAKRDFTSTEVKLPEKMSLELARFLGYLTSEGYTKAAEGSNYNIVFTKGDDVVMSDFCHLFETLFKGMDYKIIDKVPEELHKEGTKQFITQNCCILRFLEYLGAANKPARLKTIPWCILQAPREYVVEFLVGYFVGDISINEKEAHIASASREMLKQVQLLLLNMGIVSKREEYRSTWFSPLDERSKYSQLYFSGENLQRLVNNIKLPSKKGQVNILADHSYLYDRLPILRHWLDVRLVSNWAKKHGKQGGEYFHVKDLTEEALKDFQCVVDRKVSPERIKQGTDILDNIKKLLNYHNSQVYFIKIQNIEYSSELIHTFDANMPNHTILTNGIISHNSDIRLQCRSCSNPFAKGQIEEEPCWDGIGVDRYRYVKICTRKNKCFSPFRESLMRIWMEEKGDIGRGLDIVFDTFQFLKETGQIIQEGRGTKKVYRLTIPGIWTQRVWTYKEFKELILNPNRAEVYIKFKLNDPNLGTIEDNPDTRIECDKILNLRDTCKLQIKSNTAFDLYFKTICGGEVKESPRTCGMCTSFHKLEACMDVKADQEGCDDWISEEEEEEEDLLEEGESEI